MKESGKIDIEESLDRLEEIVNYLESEEVSLEDSIRLFEEGIKLADGIKKKLDQSKLNIKKVIEKSNGFDQEDFQI